MQPVDPSTDGDSRVDSQGAPVWVEHTQQELYGVFTGQIRRQGPIESWEVQIRPGDRRWIPKQFLRICNEGGARERGLKELLAEGRFRSIAGLRRLMTHEKLRGSLTDVIYSMEAAQIDFYPYQFKPVLKFIDSPANRLVLADEVGLGKTIESALIWFELRARRQARRLLIVCNSQMLAEKWRKELGEKFQVDATLGGFREVREALDRLRREGGACECALICTYSGLRPPREQIDALLADEAVFDEPLAPKTALLREVRQWNAEHAPFDLVIFDEAHYMRNPATAAFKLGESLSTSAGAVLCVSATPLATGNEDLRTLLRLIDPDFFGNAAVFEELLRENRPAVRAANALASAPPKVKLAADALTELESSRYIGGSALLRQGRELLRMLDPKDRGALSVAQTAVEKLNILGAYVTRTRRVQVEEMRAVRVPRIIALEYSPEERALYEAILGFVRQRAASQGRNFHFFEVIGWQLRAASCLPAVAAMIRDQRADECGDLLAESFRSEAAEADADAASARETSFPDDWHRLARYDFEEHDSKYETLHSVLAGELRNDKCIIFSYYRGTLAYLERRLVRAGIRVEMIHGGIAPEERTAAVERFAADPGAGVLLSSEVGSEGIDLQFCSVLINYDLPWNPMRIEQRIGRIDRVGQEAPRLRIFHFKIRDTVEERIFEKLHRRLDLFRNSLGDLDAVLGEEVQKLTRELFSAQLTPAMEEERIAQTAQVIEHRQHEMQELETRGEGLVALADYLQQKIRGSRGLGRYITPEELEEAVRDFFARNAGADLRWNDPAPHCFRLKLRPDLQSELTHALGADRSMAAQRLRQREFCVCFRPDEMRKLTANVRRQVLFVNHLSPLVRWITRKNEGDEALFERIAAAKLQGTDYPRGIWVYLVRRWDFKGALETHRLAFAMAGPERETLWGEEAEGLLLQVVRTGAAYDYPTYEASAVLDQYHRAAARLDTEKTAAYERFEAENTNHVQVRRERLRLQFERRIRSAAQAVETARGRGTAPNRLRGLQAIERNEREAFAERVAEIDRGTVAHPAETDVAVGLIWLV